MSYLSADPMTIDASHLIYVSLQLSNSTRNAYKIHSIHSGRFLEAMMHGCSRGPSLQFVSRVRVVSLSLSLTRQFPRRKIIGCLDIFLLSRARRGLRHCISVVLLTKFALENGERLKKQNQERLTIRHSTTQSNPV